MKNSTPQKQARRRTQCRAGMSLIEIMVTVVLLSVIIIGLTAMFVQTRKAFNSGIGNVEYQDAGRVALEMIGREMSQMAPSGGVRIFVYTYPVTNNGVVTQEPGFVTNDFALNFFSQETPGSTTNYMALNPADNFTNAFHSFVFLTKYNQQWRAIGYQVVSGPNDPLGVGTLWRFEIDGTTLTTNNYGPLTTNFTYAPAGRVIDGVVDLRVRAFDPHGVPWQTNTPNVVNVHPYPDGELGYEFYSNAVPAYVELELGVMESQTVDRYRSMAGVNALNFLATHAGQAHIFRQRVTIPSADRAVYVP